MKKIVCILLTLLMAFGLAAPALGELEYVINTQYYNSTLDFPGLGVKMNLRNPEEWTIVTAETLEEHADLITARGDTMENARFRFENANILFELYNPKRIPDAVIRVQCYEDEWSRNIWSTASADKDYYEVTQLRSLTDELNSTLYQGYLRMFNVRAQSDTTTMNIKGSVNWYPPYDYESGLFTMFCVNGKFYIASYLCMTPASSTNYLYQSDMLYTYAINWTPVEEWDGVKLMNGVQGETPVTDLASDWSRLILNAHSGDFTFTGATERNAAVRVTNGEQSWDAAVDGTNYTCVIQLRPGENTVVSTANKQGLRENTTERIIAADDAVAALELTEFPYGRVLRNEVRASGKTAPGASVSVVIDDGDPQPVTVQPDGTFSYSLPVGSVEDWVDHTIEIAAHEEGLEDCTAKFTFSTGYAEAQQGIGAYLGTLSQNVNSWNINKEPDAHVGERTALEVRTIQVDHRDGILSVECRIEEDRARPIILLYPDYMDDQITPQMVITVYGEIIDPALLDPPVPRMEVEYTRNLIVQYVRW